MHSSSNTKPVIFSDTGVQILCIPLPNSLRFTADQLSHGWQICKCQNGAGIKDYHYIQWQIVQNNQLFLAVDTTLGPADASDSNAGYFCTEGQILGDFEVSLKGLLGANAKPLEGLGDVEFTLRSASAEGGEPKDVDLVIDFGNNRTGGLLIEFHGDINQDPLMHPLQLMHRHLLDSWDEKGNLAGGNESWWFSSRSHWCAQPYREAPSIENVVWVKDTVKTMLGGKKEVDRQTTVYSQPKTFQDFSQIRLGREAHDMSLVIRTEGEIRTSLSSPKRYLWAKDSSWLEGANWHMADPAGLYDNEQHAAPLQGPMVRYLSRDDSEDKPEPNFEVNPNKPDHPPRVLMMGALYELLAQTYSYINSPTYRRAAGVPQRMRRLRSVTMTYPSGMIYKERKELERQARKAVHLFKNTVALKQEKEPEFNLSIDEASAVHLTYIWSEIQKLGRNPSLWFELTGRTEIPNIDKVSPTEENEEKIEDAPAPVKDSHTRERPRARGRNKGSQDRNKDKKNSLLDLPEVRVACIDIGGGTSDLMIAKYECESHSGGDRIIGETLHRDGIYLAGDHLVKRLLERIIVPQFADDVEMDPRDVSRLFGPEVPDTRWFRAQRINWMNRLFVPLAQKYLELAVEDSQDEVISHTDPDIVALEVVESLQDTITKLWGGGHCQVNQNLNLYYEPEKFEEIIDEVFGDLILDFCETIVKHDVDVVLLAGLPTKLKSIQELVETYLPLPSSRIIPMYHRYVGTWYPYQNPDHMNPGVIVDPKSTVVVGAAVEFSARFGMLSQFKFRMKDEAAKQSYHWGVMTETRIDEHQILFESTEELDHAPSNEKHVINVSDRRLVIGRKRLKRENAQATPVYVIKVNVGQQLGEIDVNVTLVRERGPEGEETLDAIAVDGIVAGEPAVLGENVSFEWRTLADERYYLDTGGLDKIEMGIR